MTKCKEAVVKVWTGFSKEQFGISSVKNAVFTLAITVIKGDTLLLLIAAAVCHLQLQSVLAAANLRLQLKSRLCRDKNLQLQKSRLEALMPWVALAAAKTVDSLVTAI